MKLRNFKKALHRAGLYANYYPRINYKIFIKTDCIFAYYTCHKLRGRLCLETGEFTYIIKKGGEQ